MVSKHFEIEAFKPIAMPSEVPIIIAFEPYHAVTNDTL